MCPQLNRPADVRASQPFGSAANILVRIDQRLQALALSDSSASLRAGLSRDAIRNMRRQSLGCHGISTMTLVALAEALDTSPSWLLGDAAVSPRIPPEDWDNILHSAPFPRGGGGLVVIAVVSVALTIIMFLWLFKAAR